MPETRRNSPVEVTWENAASRLFNLVIALINSRTPRTTQWIVDNVAGYSADKEASARKRFARDRETLSQLGIHLKAITTGEADKAEDNGSKQAWILDREASFLPEITFTPEEAEVVASAVRWNQHGKLSSAARSAYKKLASAGLQRGSGHGASVIANIPDHTDLNQESIDAIFRGLDHGLRLSFYYYRSLVDTPTVRTVEPWAYGAIDGKVYLTGFDIDRGEQRTFRLSRISDITALAQFSKHPVPEGTSQELIRQGLAAAGKLTSAQLRFTQPHGAEELRRLCDSSGYTKPVDRAWLIHTAAAYAPEVIVEQPRDVVDDVIAVLRSAAGASPNKHHKKDQHGRQNSGLHGTTMFSGTTSTDICGDGTTGTNTTDGGVPKKTHAHQKGEATG